MAREKKITDRTLQTMKPKISETTGKPHRSLLPVERNLYFQVRPARDGLRATRSWLFRFSAREKTVSKNGTEYTILREMGLGPYPDVGLAEARDKAQELRRQLRDGKDPILARDAKRAAMRLEAARAKTFKECAKEFIEKKQHEWKNEKHKEQWTNTLETYVFPKIGAQPVNAIDTPLVTKVLDAIWKEKPETARRVRGRIERILDYAKVQDYRTGENPARWHGHLSLSLSNTRKARPVKHHPAVPVAEMPALMADLRERKGMSARALEFTILTAARTGETIGAEWSEIDLQSKVWTIPAKRMKSGKEHRVPLSPAALRVIESLTKTSGLVFPVSNMAMLELVRGMKGRGSTVHGFRSSFRVWAATQTNFPREICEAALAHTVGAVEGAYQREDYLEKRRGLMNAWARWMEGAKK